MKYAFLFLVISSFISSCNIVRIKQNSATHKLDKQGIVANKFVNDSLTMKYWKGGSGPVLVFIHGFGGDALMTWEKELKQFSKNHTVIALDVLWFGESMSIQKPQLSAQRDAVINLLKSLKIEKATFIGQSYGGFIAIDIAINHPEMTEKLVIANCPGTTFDVKELEGVCASFNVKSIEELFILYKPEHVQRLVDLSSFSNPKLPKFLLKQSFDTYFDFNHEQQFLLLNTLPLEQNRFQEDANLKTIPTLVLWGEKDEIFSFDSGKHFAESIEAEFVSIPKCGHAPQIDDHKSFLFQLDKFFKK
jgi:pimeloyl-ACP methyl ester carboxylesterase